GLELQGALARLQRVGRDRRAGAALALGPERDRAPPGQGDPAQPALARALLHALPDLLRPDRAALRRPPPVPEARRRRRDGEGLRPPGSRGPARRPREGARGPRRRGAEALGEPSPRPGSERRRPRPRRRPRRERGRAKPLEWRGPGPPRARRGVGSREL